MAMKTMPFVIFCLKAVYYLFFLQKTKVKITKNGNGIKTIMLRRGQGCPKDCDNFRDYDTSNTILVKSCNSIYRDIFSL